jgi:hypothetical protein
MFNCIKKYKDIPEKNAAWGMCINENIYYSPSFVNSSMCFLERRILDILAHKYSILHRLGGMKRDFCNITKHAGTFTGIMVKYGDHL